MTWLVQLSFSHYFPPRSPRISNHAGDISCAEEEVRATVSVELHVAEEEEEEEEKEVVLWARKEAAAPRPRAAGITTATRVMD